MNKKLYRSSHDKIIAGVCGGLAEYFDVDPTIVRLLFVLAVVMGGGGVILYLILWLIMPKSVGESAVINEQRVRDFAEEVKEKAEDFKESMKQNAPEIKSTVRGGRHFFGWILVILGLIFLFNSFSPFWFRTYVVSFWPVLLIVLGLLLIFRPSKK